MYLNDIVDEIFLTTPLPYHKFRVSKCFSSHFLLTDSTYILAKQLFMVWAGDQCKNIFIRVRFKAKQSSASQIVFSYITNINYYTDRVTDRLLFRILPCASHSTSSSKFLPCGDSGSKFYT